MSAPTDTLTDEQRAALEPYLRVSADAEPGEGQTEEQAVSFLAKSIVRVAALFADVDAPTEAAVRAELERRRAA